MPSYRARCASCAPVLFLPALVVSFTLSLAAPSAAAQTPAQPAASPQATAQSAASVPAITANADEVSLDLVVRTKGGKPITNLQASDFTVTDNGAPVKLSQFRLVSGNSESDHLVTFVFDRLETGPAKSARELVGKMMRVFPMHGYSYAVMEMNGRLQLIQSWTGDHDSLLKGVADATGPATNGKSPSLTPAEKQIIDTIQDDSLSTDFADRNRARILIAALEESQRRLEDQHDFPSLTALEALAMSEKQITGRKFIVWFSQGISASNDSRDAVKALAAQANRAGVTIIAIDTLAMNDQMGNLMMSGGAMAAAGPGSAMSSAMSLAANGYGRGQAGPPIGQLLDAAQNMTNMEFGSGEDTKSPLMRLAFDTGGVYFRAGAGTKGPLRDLQQNLTDYYEATYTPSIKDYNGAFRPVAVQPLRKGIVVKTRAGYFAVPPENGSGIRPFEVPLLSILAEPQYPADVAFSTQILHLGQISGSNSADLAVQVPVSQLQIHDDGNTHLSSLHLSIVSLVKNDKDAVVQRFSEDIPRHEAPDMLRLPENQFITMQRHFSAEPGTYTLETAVLDRLGNKSGAQRTTFTISPPDQGPALSDVALVRSIEPVHSDTASFEPMRYRNGRVIPDLAQMLPEGTQSLSVFFLIHPLPPSAGAPELSLQILRNGSSLGKIPLELSKSDGLGAVPYLGTVGGHVFPPGNYKIVATLTQGGHSATSDASFSVEGTIAATMASNDAVFSATAGSAADAATRSADERLAASAVTANSRFVFSASKDPVPAPSPAEAHDMIEAARQRALAWSESLPNFMCLEVTDHSVDPESDGNWHHKDTALQMMRYVDHKESRTTLELNGEKHTLNNNGAIAPLPDELDFAHSIGEFGGMFQLVFDPSAQAKFTWQESDTLDGEPVQVFAYSVDLAHSSFSVAGENLRQIVVGFHGLVYIDGATHSIRRITVDAENIPDGLRVRATSISVDYNWAAIAGHDYLLPSRGAISLREGKHEAVLNEFEFRNYRRFGSQIRVLSSAESKQLQPH